MLRTTLTIFLFVLGLASKSQVINNKDTILLLNGKTIACDILETDDFITQYQFSKKNGKIKSRFADNTNVFELQFAQKKDTVLYFQDTLIGNELTLPEMRNFVYGEKDARNRYKTHWYFVGGAALGFTSVLLDTYLYPKEANIIGENPGPFKVSPSVFPIIVPFAYTLSVGLPKTRLKRKHISYWDLRNDEFYQRGFEKVARQKRIFAALESTLGGMALGYICYFIFRP